MTTHRSTDHRRAPDEHCSHAGCTATIPGHAWGRIKSDWFFQKDGRQFCPEHTPDWVAMWRARKRHDDKKKD